MHRLLLLTLPVLLVVACTDPDGDGVKSGEEKKLGLDPKSADSDGDGLMDGDELAMGADPLNVDTDGDGLNDGAEVENGADPTLADTDADGYSDFDEVQTGHDPADANDRIYQGGWPYYADKDSIGGNASLDGTVQVGERFGRFVAVDQFGDEVDLWDFYNEDKPIVIDMSAQWCGPCNSVAAWLDGESLSWMEPMNPIRKAVRDGEVYWVTIMIQDRYGAPASKKTAKEWYRSYPSEEVPVMADSNYDVAYYIPAAGIPAFVLLKPDLTVDDFNPNDGYQALETLNSRL
ncbi:MAG: hypothetical protein H6734_28340 [Alphaproteobacteria bacterium]|nr:hypothetical protein [Alphaproteobacteria bacterium]MCB9684300.1 hypothetical protein [Alphaproteobacteria bacterium]